MTLTLRSKPTNRAFERLYRAHVGDVYRYALAVTGNAADAEDVAQTTFMNAYRALERGEQPTKPRHWLISIAHNVCRQRFRQISRRPAEVAYEDDVAEALVPSEETPTAADIQRALGQLALHQREALVMRELEGRSYAEIAELLGLSIASVETLLFRARRALREQLEGSLSCSEAEAALSLQLDRRLDRSEAARLRAHLRACETCRLLARRQRAQRKGLRALALVPVPPGLSSWFGAGSIGSGAAGVAATGMGAAVAAKAAAVTVAAVAVGAGGYTFVQHETAATHHHGLPAAAPRTAGAGANTAAKSSARAGASGERADKRRRGGAGALARPEHPAATAPAVAAGGQPHRRTPTPTPRSARAGGNGKAHTSTQAHSRNAPAKKTAVKAKLGPGNHGRTAAPIAGHSCGNRQSPATSTEPAAETTTTTTVETTTTSGSTCSEAPGRGKGSSKNP